MTASRLAASGFKGKPVMIQIWELQLLTWGHHVDTCIPTSQLPRIRMTIIESLPYILTG